MMSTHSQHSQTNGASLEDCHTNFFALTDLCGIKWHVYKWESNGDSEPLEDPVLKSYSRCLAANVLCVWRRTWNRHPEHQWSQHANQRHHSLRYSAKELWVFWYGDEPDLSTLVSPELMKNEAGTQRGSWDWESGLSYEFRTILFKALHNLIERCLVTREFVRMGKWFVQPYDGPEPTLTNNSTNLSFRLSFFIHGESTVCASMDIRQHPPIRRLSKAHIVAAQQTQQPIPVILGPYGMRGSLTGVTYRSNEHHTQKLIEDWSRYFPYPINPINESIPPVVQVTVGGYKLRYPTSYVLVTDMDHPSLVDTPDNSPQKENWRATEANCTDNVSPFRASTHTLLTSSYLHCAGRGLGHSRHMAEQVWQDNVQVPLSQFSEGLVDENLSVPELAGQWEFANPSNKTNCTCQKCKSDVKSHKKALPFHWRLPPESPVLRHCGAQADTDTLQSTSRNNSSSLSSGYKGGIRTPLSVRGVADQPSLPSIDSPASITPSPLPTPTPRTPHSQSAAVPNQSESNVPMMSPAPPSNTSVIDPNLSDSTDTKQNVLDILGPPKSSSSISHGLSPYPGSLEGTPCKSGLENSDTPTDTSTNEFHSNKMASCQSGTILKRPLLLHTDYLSVLEQEPKHRVRDPSMLYACFSGLEYPMKKVKREEEEELWPPYRPPRIAQLLETKADTLFLHNEYKMSGAKRSSVKRPLDPYIFDEDYDHTRVKEEKDDKGDEHSPNKKIGNLFTNEGLVPKVSDLDDIFDSPVDDYPVQTPPGSNKPVCSEDTSLVQNRSNNVTLANKNNTFELTQLTKMYPTPPSLEHNPEHDATIEDGHLIKQEPDEIEYPFCPKEESESELSLVYKPAVLAPFIGSERYKPLYDLPSRVDPVVLPQGAVYNPSWHYQNEKPNMQNTSHHQSVPVSTPVHHVPLGPPSGPRIGMSPISPFGELHRGPPSVNGPSSTGVSFNYDLTSPASNNSSYLNKQLPSVEAPNTYVPEASALMVNVILQDSSINIFKDHNFDSCTMCVCNNNNEKVVGNIRGKDGSLYLPLSQLSNEEEFIDCTCGFSAIVNRSLAYQSGLFYEDEADLSGIHDKLITPPKKSFASLVQSARSDSEQICGLDQIPQYIIEFIQSQSLVTLCTPSSVLYRSMAVYETQNRDTFNHVEYADANDIAQMALDQSRLDFNSHNTESQRARQQLMHKWIYFQFEGPSCSQDMIRCMKALQPFLQEAIQKKRSTRLWEPVYNISGPLTWRQFHRMAVRGTEDMAEPLPIPLVLAGHEKDWLSVAPQSIKHWEKLLLEPYSQPRNIAYVVVSPDNEFILNQVRNFFKELSSIYELCRLGRHSPIRKVLRDGIMRVSKNHASKVSNESLDNWFSLLGDSPLYSKLRIYSQICCHILAPHLMTLSMDKSLFEYSTRSSDTKQAPSPTPMPPPSSDMPTSNSSSSNATNESDNYQNNTFSSSGSTPAGFGPGSSLVEVDEDDGPPPAIIVYLIDPFTVGDDSPDKHRLISHALLRCFKSMQDKLPESMQSHVHVQVISLESILELAHDSHDKSKRIDELKSLAFSVFTQCRRIVTHSSNVRSLTGFGPASVFDFFLKPAKEIEEKSLNSYAVFSPAYILAPIKESRDRHKEAEEALGAPREKSTVLYCTYCLSEDQRLLLASATDELGEILETISINIEIPNRTRRKRASSRRHGLRKLMDWILGIMSIGVNPWRLVIGKLGRIGHGELKGWWSLLSRKSLALASKNLKEMCKQCAYLFPSDAPSILSACVVSLEPDSAFRMMPDVFTPDERFGQNSKNCNLSTPQDSSCTHILVFPTSATAQSAQPFQDDSMFNIGVEGDIDIGLDGVDGDMEGVNGGIDNIFSDIFSEDQNTAHDSDLGQQVEVADVPRPASHYSGQAKANGLVMADPQEDFLVSGTGLQQQPLALGYYVSTAPTGQLPTWFWSSCPHLESACPTFLKSALHLNQPAVTQAEDYMQTHASTKVHPLDSTSTADVLRFVLEGYNGLSWLIMDPKTQDRRSCLPLHMQVLSNLYNLMSALI